MISEAGVQLRKVPPQPAAAVDIALAVMRLVNRSSSSTVASSEKMISLDDFPSPGRISNAALDGWELCGGLPRSSGHPAR